MELLVTVSLFLSGGTRGLGSELFSEREAASQRLEAAGWMALPALLAAEGSPDPEVRHRARELTAGWRLLGEEASCYGRAFLLLGWADGPSLPDGLVWELRKEPRLAWYCHAVGQELGVVHGEEPCAGQEFTYVVMLRRRLRSPGEGGYE